MNAGMHEIELMRSILTSHQGSLMFFPFNSLVPPDAPETYCALMEACWALNPNDRPSFEEICCHSCFKDLDSY